MAKNYYCYPRLGFVPETRTLSDGTLVAHAGDTPFWCAQDMRVYRLDDAGVFVRQKVYEWDTKKYAQIGPSGHPIGHTYPGFNYHGTNYDVHRLMAIAWIGPIPKGFVIDHIDGNTMNNDIRNLRAIPDAINRRDGGFMRKLRNNGIIVAIFPCDIILEGYARMAEWKASHSEYAYGKLCDEALKQVFLGEIERN